MRPRRGPWSSAFCRYAPATYPFFFPGRFSPSAGPGLVAGLGLAYFSGLLLAGVLLGGLLGLTLPHYFQFIQQRPGILLPDPLLSRFAARDVSWLTFTGIYAGILVALAYALPRPLTLLRALWAYLILHAFRLLTLWLLPLAPPEGLLLLHDPLVDSLFYASAEPITKDLFFSGHTATLALLALAVRGRWLRRLLLAATVLVAGLVLLQHVHYTYDVLAAPFFAGLSYRLAGYITRWARRPLVSS